jgi:hypothetical protein
MEIEYNSFSDRAITALGRIFSAEFRSQFKELKKSKETYVFNNNGEGRNSFSTDGDKLYINYSMAKKENKQDGSTIFSALRHETEHGVQFEHGEVGFKNDGGGWEPINADFFDEMGAYDAEANTSVHLRSPSIKSKWGYLNDDIDLHTDSQKIDYLKSIGYNLPKDKQNNTNETKVKNSSMYALPYKERRRQ